MSVLRIAHRAGNDLDLLQPALDAGADLVEADVKVSGGRLEVRHARSLGPLPWWWEPFYLVPRGLLQLHDLVAALPPHAHLMLDLKGRQRGFGPHVREAMAVAAPGAAYTVCSREWAVLDAFAGLPHVRVVHSARTRLELRRLHARLLRHPTWGVSLHRDLLSAAVVARLHDRADMVMTWPIDDAASYDEVVVLGVDGVISNDLPALPR